MTPDIDDAIFAAERYGEPIPGARSGEPRDERPCVLILHDGGVPDALVRARVPSWKPSSYLVSFDPDRGIDSLVVSLDIDEARRFTGFKEAMDFWSPTRTHRCAPTASPTSRSPRSPWRCAMPDRDVSSTYLWANGMVMTFDADGEQITDLQGPNTPQLQEAIRARSTPETEWVGWGEDGPAVWAR